MDSPPLKEIHIVELGEFDRELNGCLKFAHCESKLNSPILKIKFKSKLNYTGSRRRSDGCYKRIFIENTKHSGGIGGE